MAVKKRRVHHRKAKRAPKVVSGPFHATTRRINITLRNLFLFLVIALVSYMLYKILNYNQLFTSLFSLLTIIFSFITFAFFIVLIIFIILKLAKK